MERSSAADRSSPQQSPCAAPRPRRRRLAAAAAAAASPPPQPRESERQQEEQERKREQQQQQHRQQQGSGPSSQQGKRESREVEVGMSSKTSSGAVVQDDFKRKVDQNVTRLVESYRILLKSGVVDKSLAPHAQLQLQTATSNVVFHSHALLDQVNELRLQICLQDPLKTEEGK